MYHADKPGGGEDSTRDWLLCQSRATNVLSIVGQCLAAMYVRHVRRLGCKIQTLGLDV